MLGDERGVGRIAGVDDLDDPLVQVRSVPVGTQRDDLVVQPGADLPGCADDHRLAVRADHGPHRDAALLPVVDQVGGVVQLFLGDGLGQSDPDQPGLEADGHGGAVIDGPAQVVDVDALAEHVAGDSFLEGDRGAGECDSVACGRASRRCRA